MLRYIAFLRALNVGGHNVIKMEALRGHFEALGLARVETFITSGNVIFESRTRDVAALRSRVETQLAGALGRPVAALVRTDAEVAAIARHRPFGEIDPEAPGAFNVGFTAAPLSTAQLGILAGFGTEVDRFAGKGPEIYWHCSVGQNVSKFSAPKMERALGMPITFRGMKTVARLAERYPPARPR